MPSLASLGLSLGVSLFRPLGRPRVLVAAVSGVELS